MNAEHLELLNTFRRPTERGGVRVVPPHAAAKLIAGALCSEGYRKYDTGDLIRVYRLGHDGSPQLAKLDADLVRARALALLDEANEQRPNRRLADTARLIRRREAGAASWLREVAAVVRQHLEHLDDDALDALRRASVEKRRAAVTPAQRAEFAEHIRSSRAATRAAAEADTLAFLRKWIPAETDGYPLPDLWAKFQLWREEDQVRAQHPGTAHIGRTAFYRLVARLGAARTVHAGARVLRIPAELAIRRLIRLGKHAAALVLQHEHHAARLAEPPTIQSAPPASIPTWDELDVFMPPPPPRR